MTKIIANKRLVVWFDLTPTRSWKNGALNLREWETWDRQQRKSAGWRGGLAIWKKTNCEGSRVLISRHWPHRLCWSWSVWVGRHRDGFDGPKRFVFDIHRQYRYAEIRLWFGYIRLTWQDSDYMAGMNNRKGDRETMGPKIIWSHHVSRMLEEHRSVAGEDA